MADRSTFAERMKNLREAAGLTQAALAERSGIGVSTLRQFEYGRREPTYGTLVKLAAGLGVSLSAFDASATLAAKSKAKPAAKPRRKKAE